MRERPIIFSAPMIMAIIDGRKTHTRRIVKNAHMMTVDGELVPIAALCPYGQPGDRLWVRETWNARPVSEVDSGMYEAWAPYDAIPKQQPSNAWVYFEADGDEDGPWRPSIHMPRWASRITLEITDVRVERLHDISEDDCLAEGIAQVVREKLPGIQQCGEYDTIDVDPVAEYRDLWESINGPCSWDANPWVWVIEFEMVKA